MVTIKIMSEIWHGPLWTCEFDTGIATDDLPLVHDDPIVSAINNELRDMYDSYYEFESHGEACWFDNEHEKADKPHTLELLAKLNSRLAEINDGSFVVDDQETPRVMAL